MQALKWPRRVPFLAIVISLTVGQLTAASGEESPVNFNRDIRPLLSDRCFTCHGPDEGTRETDLRFDSQESAFADLGGYHAVVPGKPEKSELLARITNADPDKRMPPEGGKSLTEHEINLLRRWIEQGAPWQGHWSFVPPQKTELPALAAKGKTNPIDHFTAARLAKEGLSFSPQADKETLIRRAALSLTGLPPTAAEIDAFLADKSNEAYERVLDRLLASPRYGERMAMYWLDAARYADTDGYQIDSPRSMWPWRDWVIKAYNDNMPFDQFTIEQLAGDMLPSATNQQRLATGFNRNHRLNAEGGALPEEFIVEYAIDRLDTTSTVWLGLTVGCARCHDHKFDPVSQKEFYQLYAYFNNIPEVGTARGDNAPPQAKLRSPLAEVSPELIAQVQTARATLEDRKQAQLANRPPWETEMLAKLAAPNEMWSRAAISSVNSTSGSKLELQADGSYLSHGSNLATDEYVVDLQPTAGMLTAVRLDVLPDSRHGKQYGYARSDNGNFVLTSFEVQRINAKGEAEALSLKSAVAPFSQLNFDISATIDGDAKSGWGIAGNPGSLAHGMSAIFSLRQPIELADGEHLRVVMRHNSPHARHIIGRFALATSSHPVPKLEGNPAAESQLFAALSTPPEKRNDAQRQRIEDSFLSDQPEIVRLTADLARLEKQVESTAPQSVPVLVMQEKSGVTPTYLLKRGQYDAPDKSELLARNIPAALQIGSNKSAPANRLELARWIVSRDNPLTARVIVNRLWQQHFGVGLVKTSEDFGSQGEWPSHPELLDWLAAEFIDSGWNVKHMHRLILSSDTYRQSSKLTPALIEKDPENRLLARGPRFRLDGGAIRDSALFASGLFNGKLGGTPVKPYQPDGLWSSLNNEANFKYLQDKGDDLYRRSLYTYWKRTVGPPRMLIFDAAQRESCNVRAQVTNTPLQALVLMNDVTFIEAARGLGMRMLTEAGDGVDDRLSYGYRLAVGRKPQEKQLQILRGSFAFFQGHFENNPGEAKQFLSHGDAKADATKSEIVLATYAAIAHLMLNLDEAITLE